MSKIAWNKGLRKYTKTCSTCHKEFKTSRKKVLRCSRECFDKARPKRKYHKTTFIKCNYCQKNFEIPLHRLPKAKTHFCSTVCRDTFWGRKRNTGKYPLKVGVCKLCGKDILAKNASFVKKDRKFCGYSCRAIFYRNQIGNPILKINEETRRRLAKLASLRFKGKKWPEERRIKLSNSISGSNHWNWQGGLTPLAQKERSNLNVKEWRRKVFVKDNFTCKLCGVRGRVVINAHHILPWSKFPEFRYRVDNGVVLCFDCHLSIKGKEWFYIPKFLE